MNGPIIEDGVGKEMARIAQASKRPGVAERTDARGGPRWLNSPWGPALLALVAYGAFIVLRLHFFNGDVSRFVAAGDHFFSPAAGAQVGLSVIHHNIGYDGQFYYLLALNPFGPHPALPGASYDIGPYRAQRILYPLVVWLLTLGGHARFVPLAMLLVNFTSVVAVAALAALTARRLGVEPLLATLVAFYPGLLLSLGRDLSEPLALACALGGVVFALDHRWRWAALLLSLAVLARETTTLFALALLISAVLARFTPLPALRLPTLRLVVREEWRGAALAGLIPLLVALAWQVVLLLRWGAMGALAGGPVNVGLPFAGILRAPGAWQANHWPGAYLAANVMEGVYLLALVALVALALAARRQASYLALVWMCYLLLGVSLTIIVWLEDWAFMRAMMEYGVVSLLILTRARQSLRLVALLATMSVWGMVFITHVATY